ncbi:hypothetical protein WG616_01905 [[Mycoplasma] gypis]
MLPLYQALKEAQNVATPSQELLKAIDDANATTKDSTKDSEFYLQKSKDLLEAVAKDSYLKTWSQANELKDKTTVLTNLLNKKPTFEQQKHSEQEWNQESNNLAVAMENTYIAKAIEKLNPLLDYLSGDSKENAALLAEYKKFVASQTENILNNQAPSSDYNQIVSDILAKANHISDMVQKSKDNLKQSIAKANAVETKSPNLQRVLQEANAKLASKDATIASVDNVNKGIAKALITNDLENAIVSATTVENKIAKLEEALTNARELLNQKSISKQQVSEAVDAINKALKQTSATAQINKLPNLNNNQKASLANEIANSDESAQANIENKANAINAKMQELKALVQKADALEKSPSYKAKVSKDTKEKLNKAVADANSALSENSDVNALDNQISVLTQNENDVQKELNAKSKSLYYLIALPFIFVGAIVAAAGLSLRKKANKK